MTTLKKTPKKNSVLFRYFYLVFSLLLMANYSFAKPLSYNLYQFKISVKQQVTNDNMSVTMVADQRAEDVQSAVDQVNTKMAWAVKKLKSAKDLYFQTSSYHTRPIYKDAKLVSWQVTQTLEIKSHRIKRLTALLGDLQKQLQIKSIQFYVSDEKLQPIEQQLIEQSLGRLQQRAESIQKVMNASDYRVVKTYIEKGKPPNLNIRQRELRVMNTQSSQPTVTAGNSELEIYLTAEIQLIY